MRDKPCACVREWMNNKSEGDSASSVVMKSDLANKLQFGKLITELTENIKRRNEIAQGSDGPKCRANLVDTKSSNLFYNCSEDHNVNQPVNILQNIYESILRENRLENEEIKPVKFKFPIQCTCVQYVEDDYFGKGLGIENLYEIRNTETKSSCKMGISDEAANRSGSTSYSGSMYDCISNLSNDFLGKVFGYEQEVKKNVSSPEINKRQCNRQPSKASKCSSEPSCSVLAIQSGNVGSASTICSCNLSEPTRNLPEPTAVKRRKKELVICDCKCCQELPSPREDKAITCNLNLCPSKKFNDAAMKTYQEKAVVKDTNKTAVCQRCNRGICITTEFCTICDMAPKSLKVQSDIERKNVKIQTETEKKSDTVQKLDISLKPEIQNLENVLKPRKCGSAPQQVCDPIIKTGITQQIDTAKKDLKCGTIDKETNKKTVVCKNCKREICVTTEFCTICDPTRKTVITQQIDTAPKIDKSSKIDTAPKIDKSSKIDAAPKIDTSSKIDIAKKDLKCGTIDKVTNKKTVVCKSCNREICTTTEFCTNCDPTRKTGITQQIDKAPKIDSAPKIDTVKKEAEKCGSIDKVTNKKTVVCKNCKREICVTTEFCTICDPTRKTAALEKSESTNKVPKKCGSAPEQDKKPSKNSKFCKKCNAELCGTSEVCTTCDLSHTKQNIKFADMSDSQTKYRDECACKNKNSLLEKIKMLVREHMPDCDCPNHNRQKCQEPLQNFHSQSNLQTRNFERIDKTRCCRSNNSLEDPCRLEGNTSCGNMTTRMIKSPDASYLLFSLSENFDNLIKKIASAFPDCNCPPGQNCDLATIDRMLSVKGDSPNKTLKRKCGDTKGVKATISESLIGEHILNTDELGLMEIKELTDTSIMVKYEIPKLEGIRGYELYVNDVFVQNLRCNTSTMAVISELPPSEKTYKIICVKE